MKGWIHMNGIVNIDNRNNNIAFSSRYIKFLNPEKFPKEILTAVKTNKSLYEFISESKPKTLLEKFKDLFRKDECIEVAFNRYTEEGPYAEEVLSFHLGELRKNGSLFCTNSFVINANTSGRTVKNPTSRIKEVLDNITDFKEKLSSPYPQHIDL